MDRADCTTNTPSPQSECYNEICDMDRADCTTSNMSEQPIPADPWSTCPECQRKFNDGVCDYECKNAQCNYDGMDCLKRSSAVCP